MLCFCYGLAFIAVVGEGRAGHIFPNATHAGNSYRTKSLVFQTAPTPTVGQSVGHTHAKGRYIVEKSESRTSCQTGKAVATYSCSSAENLFSPLGPIRPQTHRTYCSRQSSSVKSSSDTVFVNPSVPSKLDSILGLHRNN